jgi:hypothetical protein
MHKVGSWTLLASARYNERDCPSVCNPSKIQKGGFPGSWIPYQATSKVVAAADSGLIRPGRLYETHLSTKQAQAQKRSWFPCTHGNQKRSQSFGAPQKKRKKSIIRLIGHSLMWPFFLSSYILSV